MLGAFVFRLIGRRGTAQGVPPATVVSQNQDSNGSSSDQGWLTGGDRAAKFPEPVRAPDGGWADPVWLKNTPEGHWKGRTR